MGKGFKHGSGGGNPLNFKVVGGMQPENPKENTIWVNTDVDIPEWIFASENPYVRSEDIYANGAVKSGYYIKTETGAETSSSDWKIVTVDIPDGTTHFTTTTGSYSSSTVAHGFYDADGNLIATALRTAGATTAYEIPSGTKSIRVSLYSTDTASIIATYYSGVPAGAVWISTGTASNVEFNALKKNGIMVYPISAKQYIGGTWVEKEAKTYQNGAWDTLWNGVLYDEGNEFETITGGWTADGYVVYSSSEKGTCYTGTKNADSLQTRYVSGYKYYMFGTQNKIDLSKVDHLELRCERVSGSNLYIVASPTKSITLNTTTPYISISATGTVNLDVSGIDSAYIALIPRPSATEIPVWQIRKVRCVR